MQVTVDDRILRLATGICGGVCSIDELVMLGIGTLLIEPRYEIQELGELVEISYRKNGEVFTHCFHKPPKLVHSQTALFILSNTGFNVVQGCGIVEIEDLEKKP